MNLFGIGTSEFIIIFILALIFLGPQRLPEYANKLGQKIREWRMMSQVFMVEWKEELAALEEARQSLAEARAAVLEARETVTTEVKGVSDTVSTEMKSAQQDISAQLYQAKKAVSNETNQVRDTIEKAKQGKADIVPAGETTGLPAESPVISSSAAADDGADEDTIEMADSDIADVDVVSDVSDISDVEELEEDDVSSAVVENTIAPPRVAKQAQSSQPTELTEIDVTEVQTVGDVAADVAEKIATEVATKVARKITQNMTSDMAEEVAALVMAKLAEAGINGNTAVEGGEQPEDVADAEETLESIQ